MGEHLSELSALIRTVRNRWRARSALRAWTLAAGSAALVLALALSVQRFVAPDGGPLIALWVVAGIAAMVCLGWFVAPLRRTPGQRQVARYIEECCPELEDSLVTAIVQGIAAPSPMTAAVAADAARRTRGLDLDRIVSRRTLRHAAIRAAAATLVLCAAAGFAFEPASRAARVLAVYLFPSRLALDVVPGDARVREGASLRIIVRIPGAVGGVVPVLRVGKGTEWREARMEAGRDGFITAFANVAESFKYAVTAAGTSSREYAVTVIRPPRVERIDLRYVYPTAFGMQPRQEEDGGDIYGPAGTRVHIVVHADKPVTQAALTLTGGQRVALQARDGVLEGDLTIVDDASYRVALADADGLANPGETEYFIRTLEDRPPDVRIMRPASDRQVTPIEEVPIEARADDDFGIAALDLVYAVRGAEPKAVPFRREGSATSASGTRTIYLEDLDVKPGDFVTYYARARDVSRGKRSTEARSDIFFLEITPFEEEFVAAQSQGGGGGEQQFDDLVQAEKDIITATWKLDSRAKQSGARSEDDTRTVAKAQGDLRTKAMASLGQMQRANNLRRVRPGGGRAAGAAPADPSSEAMAKAADAMGRAEQQLGALKTSEALPHEMTALNELLRAQSETRRKEVQQQQANGNGRGSNRQQQDLSSLFDRELARQQQTNYETPTSRETREEKADGGADAALDKIRELARRQDELNKQQEQVAKKQGATDEETRRQLERLTREQSELRKQAEELAQQLQQSQGKQAQSGEIGRGGRAGQAGQSGRGEGGQAGQPQQGGRGQSDQNRQQASRELQQISEEMQGAASELRRDNPRQASERGTRAAERLRDLEQRMRSTQPDDRRRAMGELQLESRELADAQRKLAVEGSGRGRGDNSADAARRRAGEQERLADRTQRLEQSVKQLAGAPGAEERQRNALNDTARELDRQRLSDRMRNAARAERQAGDGRAGATPQQASSGREGQAIAAALEQIAERLGSANGQTAASQQLSQQLSRIRELREKLTSLDRQLAGMKASQAGEAQQQQGQGRAQKDGGSQPGAQGGRGQRGGSMQNGDSDQPWEDAKQMLSELRKDKGSDIDSPAADGFNPGRSAPGTEGWKQDFAKWETLKTQIAASLERAESSAAVRLRDQQTTDRLSAGASQAVPDQYKRLVDKYYEALASKRRDEK